MNEYKVIQHHLPPDFHKLVSEALAAGWKLAGGVSIIALPKDNNIYQMIYAQAVTR